MQLLLSNLGNIIRWSYEGKIANTELAPPKVGLINVKTTEPDIFINRLKYLGFSAMLETVLTNIYFTQVCNNILFRNVPDMYS